MRLNKKLVVNIELGVYFHGILLFETQSNEKDPSSPKLEATLLERVTLEELPARLILLSQKHSASIEINGLAYLAEEVSAEINRIKETK